MSDTATGRVGRRRVFYIPGYDPFPPRRYRELYRSEGAAQAAISGYSIELPSGKPGAGWDVVLRQGNSESRAGIEVLIWSDLVQASMAQGIAATYLQLLRTAWTYVASGALGRLMRLRKGPMIAALYPIAMLLLQALLALVAAAGIARLVEGVPVPGRPWTGLLAGAALFAAIMVLWRRWDSRFFAYYLMHDYAFTARWGGAYPPALEARLAAFGDRIAGAATEGWDEVLVVGHSSGAHLAVSVLADLVRQNRLGTAPAIGFVSLGQVVPMVSFLPDATRLRADLALMAEQDRVTWIDVTAPGDGCAFALCDPVSVSGVAPKTKRWPLVVSAAFRQSLAPDRWKALRWRFFRLHFQYLCAFDHPGVYDYFLITAGPQTLAERFADVAASPSRIERPLNGYGAGR